MDSIESTRLAIRSPCLCSRPELEVVAVLRTARPVVEICPLVAAGDDRGEDVVRIHDGFDKNHRVVRRGEGVSEVTDRPDDKRSRRGVAMKHLRQVGIGPVGNVVVSLILAEIASFDRVSAVVNQEDDRLMIVSQDGRQLLRRYLERTIADEQNVPTFGRCSQCTQQRSNRITD